MSLISGLRRQPYDFRALEPVLRERGVKLGLTTPAPSWLEDVSELGDSAKTVPCARYEAARAALSQDARPFGEATEPWLRETTTWKVQRPDAKQSGVSPKQPVLGTIKKGTRTPDGKTVGVDAELPRGFKADAAGNWTFKGNFKITTPKFPVAELQDWHESELLHALGFPSELVVRLLDGKGKPLTLPCPDRHGRVTARTGYVKLALFDKDKSKLADAPAAWDTAGDTQRIPAILARAAMHPLADFDEKLGQYKQVTAHLPDGSKVNSLVFADGDHLLNSFSKALVTQAYDRHGQGCASGIPSAHGFLFTRHVRSELYLSDEELAHLQLTADQLAHAPSDLIDRHALPVFTELIGHGKLKDYAPADPTSSAQVNAKAQEALADLHQVLAHHSERTRGLIEQVRADRALETRAKLTSFGIGLTRPERARLRTMRRADAKAIAGEAFTSSRLYAQLVSYSRLTNGTKT